MLITLSRLYLSVLVVASGRTQGCAYGMHIDQCMHSPLLTACTVCRSSEALVPVLPAMNAPMAMGTVPDVRPFEYEPMPAPAHESGFQAAGDRCATASALISLSYPKLLS